MNKKRKLQAQESLSISSKKKRSQVLNSITQLCNSISLKALANLNDREISSEEKICSEQNSKCKKEKSVNKLKQKSFALELFTQDLLMKENQLKGIKHMIKIFKTFYFEKLILITNLAFMRPHII
ncbi:15494_t:CDS:1 [Cetraspora pellucida]|uniref:15494_t:CDS:1 n=1 Tax=Cetraspora pellucida TaxID=1433469 RepID=A0A9N9INK7_9GLOM|nr:15494_t:CDS:1 [Cetraspora pellucida]